MLLVMMNFTPSGLPYLVFSDNDDIIFTQNIHIEETLLSEGIQGFYNTTLQIGSEDLSLVNQYKSNFSDHYIGR